LANLAIGQGELLVTPLQMAQFTMIVANKGVYYKPHLLKYLYNHNTSKIVHFPTDSRYITGVSDGTYDIVREAMRRVVNGGTGWNGKVPGIEMAGKTGTSENPHGDSHAWFMAFAPYELPEIAVAVILENAGGGGAFAAPIARKFLEKYFFNKIIPPFIAKKSRQDSVGIPIDLKKILPIPFSTNAVLKQDDN